MLAIKIGWTLVVVSTVLCATTNDINKEIPYKKNVDTFNEMFTQGTLNGQIRMFYLDRKFQGISSLHRDSSALGGHLKYETASFHGVRLAVALYTTNNLHMNQHDIYDPSLLGTNGESYSIIGEAYLGYNFSNSGYQTQAKIGYQKYDTPMINSDDVRMLPNTFRAYKLVSYDFKKITMQIAHVDKVAYGTYSNLFTGGGIVSATSGYPAIGNYTTGKYYNMGQAAVGKNTSGVTNLLVKYTNKYSHIEVSNDYAWNLYNTLYVDSAISWDCLLNNHIHPFLQAQFIKQNSVGGQYMKYLADSDNGKIDSIYGGVKLGATYAGFGAYIAYSQTGKNSTTDKQNNPYKNAIITQFGGMPAYTAGMVIRHQFLAGAKATKLAAEYSFKEKGVNLLTSVYFISVNMDENSGFGVARTSTEPGFDIKYSPKSLKKLQLRFRGNFPRNFSEATAGASKGWNEYRFIANYTF